MGQGVDSNSEVAPGTLVVLQPGGLAARCSAATLAKASLDRPLLQRTLATVLAPNPASRPGPSSPAPPPSPPPAP